MKAIIFLLILLGVGISWFLFLYFSGIVKKLKLSVSDIPGTLNISPKDKLQYINDDEDLSLKYEQVSGTEYKKGLMTNLSECEQSVTNGRKLIMGRGSWRATQGNIYTSKMLEKDLEDEFNERI